MEIAVDNPFKAVLSDGETILWMGKHDKAGYFKSQMRLLTLVVFWVVTFLGSMCLLPSLVEGLDPGCRDFAVAFLVVFAVAAWIFYCDIRAEKNLPWRYAVTDQRVLSYDSSGEDDVTAYLAFENIALVWSRLESKYDSSVVFDAKPPFRRISFHYVADVVEVQALVVSLLAGARQEARE